MYASMLCATTCELGVVKSCPLKLSMIVVPEEPVAVFPKVLLAAVQPKYAVMLWACPHDAPMVNAEPLSEVKVLELPPFVVYPKLAEPENDEAYEWKLMYTPSLTVRLLSDPLLRVVEP